MRKRPALPLSSSIVLLVTGIVLCMVIGSAMFFLDIYQKSLIQGAQTSSRQAVEQVSRTVESYSADINRVMTLLEEELLRSTDDREAFFDAFLRLQNDVVAVSTYDADGKMLHCWAKDHDLNPDAARNLSFDLSIPAAADGISISNPHVVSLFKGWYPWVVTMTKATDIENTRWIALDFSFDSISSYINNTGIGQRGYCFLMNESGEIIYHPQQQLIYSDLKEENTVALADFEDGVHFKDKIIYVLDTLPESGWRVVGVSYVQELITSNVDQMRSILILSVLTICIVAFLSSWMTSRQLSRPLQGLSGAMQEFEKDATHFTYEPVGGSLEVQKLSDSFGHMVNRIKHLMETVRQEEIHLRKTELKALQAQINPHFLYNTLDSISWMCEKKRTEEAVKMVNALAKLFRISISRGHELITIRAELQHAESYLQIQKYRYKNQFSYEFDVDEACLDFLCNKITLQPIIENALIHGINGLVDEGCIRITVAIEGEDIVMLVQDNGIGMTQEQAEAVLGRESSDRTGIGIKNVDERLKIHFEIGRAHV